MAGGVRSPVRDVRPRASRSGRPGGDCAGPIRSTQATVQDGGREARARDRPATRYAAQRSAGRIAPAQYGGISRRVPRLPHSQGHSEHGRPQVEDHRADHPRQARHRVACMTKTPAGIADVVVAADALDLHGAALEAAISMLGYSLAAEVDTSTTPGAGTVTTPDSGAEDTLEDMDVTIAAEALPSSVLR